MEAGIGRPVLALHGIGDTYDARFFAAAGIDLLDALALDRVHLIGNSLGERIALEIALRHPGRIGRVVLLAPSLAWRRARHGFHYSASHGQELGLVQIAPRAVVEAIVRRLIPGADEGWAAAGVDEFLGAYPTPAGATAFYAAARQIYLEEPHGEEGFWPRLQTLQPGALFIWGRRDRLVPIASRATSATHFRARATSSLTADTCRSSNVPNKPTPRSPHFYPKCPTA